MAADPRLTAGDLVHEALGLLYNLYLAQQQCDRRTPRYARLALLLSHARRRLRRRAAAWAVGGRRL
jgi:hypothetical protein